MAKANKVISRMLCLQVVAPFAGTVSLTDTANEVLIHVTRGSLRGTDIILSNVLANSTVFHPDDSDYVDQEVGKSINGICATCTQTHSEMCDNIHMTQLNSK
jgi:hypothetical protein